jgi:hypothetical protein
MTTSFPDDDSEWQRLAEEEEDEEAKILWATLAPDVSLRESSSDDEQSHSEVSAALLWTASLEGQTWLLDMQTKDQLRKEGIENI